MNVKLAKIAVNKFLDGSITTLGDQELYEILSGDTLKNAVEAGKKKSS